MNNTIQVLVSLQNLNFLVFADDTLDVVGYQEYDLAEEQLIGSQSTLLSRLIDLIWPATYIWSERWIRLCVCVCCVFVYFDFNLHLTSIHYPLILIILHHQTA